MHRSFRGRSLLRELLLRVHPYPALVRHHSREPLLHLLQELNSHNDLEPSPRSLSNLDWVFGKMKHKASAFYHHDTCPTPMHRSSGTLHRVVRVACSDHSKQEV